MNSESLSKRPLRKALILNCIALIAIIVLSALGIWLVNEWVML
ncbi:integrase [Klebsiella oxytoca]|nr:integrase [Klebsiella oxytoca]MBZ7588405.1 integrase [Klebsiella oxytoca]